ncbi:MAG: hypothetical protein GAK30_01699 [Paracidovorax wautersii]|uniref:Uncharacterized protein n=1 Tax=Paracidovorax wautersii TaxID=1177982 RepID=A0A7V8JQR3_9BURK|nr:MAG: hypothetical protein GAK30_01699 [Paracidovorax wautersii]
MMLPRNSRWPPGAPPAAERGPVDGDYAAYVERLLKASAARPPASPAPSASSLNSGDWGRDAFELDELSAQAARRGATSAEAIVGKSPHVSSTLSLPQGVRGEVERVRAQAAQARQAVLATTAPAPAPAAARTAPSMPATLDSQRRWLLGRVGSIVKWGLILLVFLPWVLDFLRTLKRR